MTEFTEEALGKLLLEQLNKIEGYEEILSLVRNNSQGNMYLIGGAVSRTLTSSIYGTSLANHDFDFVVDAVNEDLAVPDGWTLSLTDFGNPTFTKGELEVDIFPFSDFEHIKHNNLEPILENLFVGAPFTIQTLAFDINKKIFHGTESMEALRTRTFKVHNVIAAQSNAKRKGVTINELMQKKADSMGFTVIPFSE